MKKILVRPDGSKKVITSFQNAIGRTDQSFKKDCDVNEIMRKFIKTGQINHLKTNQGVYADVSEFGDLTDSVLRIQKAKEAFEALPASLRKTLGNQLLNLIDYLQDPSNDEEAIKLGLKNRPQNTAGEASPRSRQAEGASVPQKTPKPQKPTKTAPLNDDDLNDDE